MRVVALLTFAVLVAGCTSEGTGPSHASNLAIPADRRAEYDAQHAKATRELGKITSMTPVVGASVENPKRPGQFMCAVCGAPLDERGACPNCNPQGMPGVGIRPASKTYRSLDPSSEPR